MITDTDRLDKLAIYLSDPEKNISGPWGGDTCWSFGYNGGLAYVIEGAGETLREAIDSLPNPVTQCQEAQLSKLEIPQSVQDALDALGQIPAGLPMATLDHIGNLLFELAERYWWAVVPEGVMSAYRAAYDAFRFNEAEAILAGCADEIRKEVPDAYALDVMGRMASQSRRLHQQMQDRLTQETKNPC